LSSLEATLASRSAMPASAPIDIGMKVKAVPAPVTRNGPARSAQNCSCTGTCVARKIPAPIRIIPAAMTSLAEARVTSICDSPASAAEMTDAASQANPVISAEYPSTCCMRRVPMKMKAKKLAPSRKPAELDCRP
jgi:hypothetical protein